MKNAIHAVVTKKHDCRFYTVVLTDSRNEEILETLGHFREATDAEVFAFLWNRMLTSEDIEITETLTFEEE